MEIHGMEHLAFSLMVCQSHSQKKAKQAKNEEDLVKRTMIEQEQRLVAKYRDN